MNFIISIDVTKLDKTKFIIGREKNGVCPKYVKLFMSETKPSNFGDWRDENTHMIKQSQSKEERDAGGVVPILGNAKPAGGKAPVIKPSQPAQIPDSQRFPDDGSVPF